MSVEIDGIEELIRLFDELDQRCRNTAPAFADAEIVMFESIDANFRSGGRPTWPPRKKQYPHPPLIKTGTMRAQSTGAGYRRQSVGPRVGILEFGPSVPYAPFQHFGTVHIDARPFLYYQDADIDTIADIFMDFILPE